MLQCSTDYEPEPVGFFEQAAFLNGAEALQTDLDPERLLDGLLARERLFGRDRSHGIEDGPRTLYQDLLLYGDRIWSCEKWQLPYLLPAERAFVLMPLPEIATGAIHPRLKWSMAQLMQDLAR